VSSKSKVVAFATLVAAGVIASLYGDPRVTPVTHPLWARMLLRALDMGDAVKAGGEASTLFAMLSGRDSRVFSADGYLRMDGLQRSNEGAVQRLSAVAETGEVAFAVAIVQGGDYRLRARLAGDPARRVSAEIAPASGAPAVGTFSLVPAREPTWLFAGTTHLDPGRYTASLLLPAGTSLEYVEVAPPCVNAVEPIGGWRPAAITTGEDVAATALKALDLEDALAPADTPIERGAADFERDDGTLPAAHGLERTTLRGDRNGLRAVVSVELPEAGLYTLTSFGASGGGQRWRADGCRKAVLCPGSATGWRSVMTQHFSAGRHTFAVVLGDGADVERVRIERKKETPSDYMAALRRLGFDPEEGQVSWQTARAAAQFVGRLRGDLQRRFCGDVSEPVPPAQLTSPAVAAAAGAVAPVGPSVTRPADVLSGALLPPQERASPVQPGPSS
jgi:hypothetical protein